jgi:outer membrane protein TolC
MSTEMTPKTIPLLLRVAAAVLLPAIDANAAPDSREPDPLSLEEAIAIALENNPGIAARRYETAAADARSDAAFGARLPQVGLNGSVSQFREDRLMNPRRPGDGDTLQFADQLYTGEAVIRLPLFTGGRLLNESRAARLLHEASEYRLVRSKEELAYTISRVFYAVLAQRRTIEALEFSREALQEHCRRVEELIDADKAARVDLLRTEVRLADLEQQLTREQNILSIQSRLIANLTGLPETGCGEREIEGTLIAEKQPVPDASRSLALALEQRSDWLAARSALRAQERKRAAARAGRSPTVSLEGAYGNQWDVRDTDEDNPTGSVALKVEIPLFSGGVISADIREAAATLSSAEAKLRELELQIRLEVETAVLNIDAAQKQIEASGKSIEQAEESLRIEREKYAMGKGSVTDVLDAQAALLESQKNYYRSLAEQKTALTQFRLATGELL